MFGPVKSSHADNLLASDALFCIDKAFMGTAWIAAITALAVGVISLLGQYHVLSSSYVLVGKSISWGISGGGAALLIGLIAHAYWPESPAPSPSEHAAASNPPAVSLLRAQPPLSIEPPSSPPPVAQEVVAFNSDTNTRSRTLAATSVADLVMSGLTADNSVTKQGAIASHHNTAATSGVAAAIVVAAAASEPAKGIIDLSQPYLFFADFNDARRITRGQLERSFPNGLPTGIGTLEKPFRLWSVVFGKEVNANWGDRPLEEDRGHLHDFYVEVSPENYEWRIPPGYDYASFRRVIVAALTKNSAVADRDNAVAPLPAAPSQSPTPQNVIKSFFHSVSVNPYLKGDDKITRELLNHFSLYSTFGAGTVENPLRFEALVFGEEITQYWGKRLLPDDEEHPHTFYVEVSLKRYEWRMPPGCVYQKVQIALDNARTTAGASAATSVFSVEPLVPALLVQSNIYQANASASAAGASVTVPVQQAEPSAPIQDQNKRSFLNSIGQEPYVKPGRVRITRDLLRELVPNNDPCGNGTLESPFSHQVCIFGHVVDERWGSPPSSEQLDHLHLFYIEVSPGKYEWRLPPEYNPLQE